MADVVIWVDDDLLDIRLLFHDLTVVIDTTLLGELGLDVRFLVWQKTQDAIGALCTHIPLRVGLE